MDITRLTRQRLEPFLRRAENAQGDDIVQLITDVLSEPGVFVFAELSESPNVIKAKSIPQVETYIKLLELFQYGTMKDYKANAGHLPPLNDKQTTKLKHLSILTLAKDQRCLSYSTLMQELDIDSVRALEDLVIDAFYQGILTGKFDQRQRQLQIDFAMGRDVRTSELETTLQSLAAWAETSSAMVKMIDQRILSIKGAIAQNETAKKDYQQHVEQLRKEVSKKSNEVESEESQDMDQFDSMDRGRVKKSRGLNS